MDPNNQNPSQTLGENVSGLTEILTVTPAAPSGTEVTASDSSASVPTPQLSAPARPRRPQRTPRVEGSVDVCDPKPDPPGGNQDGSTPDTPAGDSHPKPLRPGAVKSFQGSGGPEVTNETSLKVGPKVPGHIAGARSPISVRAASVPQQPSSSPIPHNLNPHAQRAFSVAGTTDTQTQVVEDFRLHIITWNVGGSMPPDDITALLGLHVGDGNTDMYIIGLQEVNSMINKRLKDVLFTDQWSDAFMERLSPFGYILVTSQRMQGVLLLVFAKYYHLPFLRGMQTETTRTGLGGYWGNKGGVSARMSVFGHTICFLNCHLPAHMENSDQRMEDFESILQQQQFEGQAATGVLDHDVVFWFGDLNFRIDELEIPQVKTAIDHNKLNTLWEKDQLNKAKDSEPVLEGFLEGPLKFPPTYKFDVGTDTYDTSGKKRKPAWTDRILWRLRATAPTRPALHTGKRGSMSGLSSGTKVTQHFYRSHMEYMVSDHKPVSSIFTLQFPYKVDMPLVTIMVEDEWNCVAEATCRFKTAPNFARSSWDWIGLYKVGFKHHKDYVGYVWAKQEEADYHRVEHEVTFTEEELPKGSGDYILGYYSNNTSTLVGVTEPFQIQLPTSSLAGSPSDDSSEFTSEDDSTVVGMTTKSRSPSPHKKKHRARRSHSRSRSGSPVLSQMRGLNLQCDSGEASAPNTDGPSSDKALEGMGGEKKPSADAGDSRL
ncbi:phosphatidylinositol 4,5-bisphosphate 5-phosphatase A [Esox lucius]|uniref:phosphatidylinositol 4,5-bisphosphate 5-phosphatase A n=1 Tax=Esox lucius TaxID=8010 RepID=UPI001476AD88|nr:phosphatidylinositol 4,5-bisphosphate 5-phosphatase A [Esox lucius]XP_019907984.2 phosphatidylinositol 4,5-bisphosphate 5-phosphatase A [Esox lucius]XP_019907986.2 phosphatidylinositol 4,5-bisphosphate 5-phosphatase A [Esox lucius]